MRQRLSNVVTMVRWEQNILVPLQLLFLVAWLLVIGAGSLYKTAVCENVENVKAMSHIPGTALHLPSPNEFADIEE